MKWSLWMTVVLSALCGCALRPPEETYCGLTSQAGITVRKPKGVSASDHLPTILFHHGIGANWVGTVFDAERAIANGYVAVMVNSRLSSTNTTTLPTGASEGHYWQAAREVQCLVRMLRDDAKHANKYNVDPNKVAFAGFSMGGILGYHLVTPSAAGREVAKEVAGLDPLASKYPNESGQPDAFIALSTALDPIAAGTGCLNVSRPFIARYEGTRAILHPWVRGAGTGRDSPYMCASNMSAADLASAPTRMDRTSTARGIVANAITARLSAYQGSTCSGKCDASCAQAGGVCAPSVVGGSCTCHTAKLLSTTNAGAREPVPGTSSFVKDSAREGWERWFAVSWVDPTRRTPVLMMHGDEDPLIHPSSTGLAYDLLQHLGYPVKMVTFSGVNHVWNANTEAGSSPERVLRSQEIFQFLGRNLGWKGKRPSDPCAAPPQVSMSQVAADTLAAVANETLTDAERQYIEDDLATLAASGPVSPPRHCEAAL